MRAGLDCIYLLSTQPMKNRVRMSVGVRMDSTNLLRRRPMKNQCENERGCEDGYY